MEVKLPTKIVESVVNNPKAMLIYSPPKCGKTTLLSKLDNCLIIDLEEGSSYVSALKVEINSLEELQELGKAIVKAGKPYKYVAIDTITRLEELCVGLAKTMYQASPMGKNFDDKNEGISVLTLPNGAGYGWLRTAFELWFSKLLKLADNVIFVGHLKDRYLEKKGKEVLAKDLDLTGKLKQITCAKVDAIGYLSRGENSELILSFKSTDEVNCGARPNHLKGKDIVIAEYDAHKNDLINVAWDKVYID